MRCTCYQLSGLGRTLWPSIRVYAVCVYQETGNTNTDTETGMDMDMDTQSACASAWVWARNWRQHFALGADIKMLKISICWAAMKCRPGWLAYPTKEPKKQQSAT